MVHYKLTYFNGRGAGECARQVFALADQKYEDVRLTQETFVPLKATFPFGQVPVLEVDGQQLAQSQAICRYLAKTFGFAGATPFESALIDSLADAYTDYRAEMKTYYYTALGFMTGDVDKPKTDVLLPARTKFLGFITKFLKKNSSGFLVGDKISWVDLLVAEHVADMTNRVPEYIEGFPEVKAHMERIQQTPRIKKWIETRPETPF
uniref:glutathione S-transferase 2 n=1 Tax=Heligmosomoides polygyrus TaxID=6339 RepID=UPI000040203A|nr:Chain A, glutathione S-transferase 2 [Heligmosomoides polygyrus]1TW9_B Chain B, glutathione S-transferase 2 [Heligmosomoides polygyrus]1TW9_C Chain C, glutathione S-transferase 2 [Heligmosomoides polygyrus]1TW9_D Chain D, glutathione S-transferase 2 [Heligmosomoides polygyrus]1TW9_E Chain E, glutathione S-transferase 2 [Heligmosomoides polygyrus]1TW9_F Chain F, glutathione S-transferase 2 [Heligmosomoides polygyrus]1TW9_G Chain G, glutathione S-transferase 2 [Heligmosomoides polygyrus]1TW